MPSVFEYPSLVRVMPKDWLINHENYFTDENFYISNSKVSDFLKSKEYFLKKHISDEIPNPSSIPMKIGSMVDALLCGEEIPYSIKVLKREDPEEYQRQSDLPEDRIVTQAQFDEAQARVKAITREPFFEEYAKDNRVDRTEFQTILLGHIPYGIKPNREKIPICGMADAITRRRRKAVYIDDFKSTSPMKVVNPKTWYWVCHDMGYFRQLAVYKYLFEQTRERLDKRPIICRHIVVTKLQENLYKVHLFVIPNELLIEPWKQFERTVKAIWEEKDWKDEPVEWKSAIDLGKYMPNNFE